jgi:acetyl esterase
MISVVDHALVGELRAAARARSAARPEGPGLASVTDISTGRTRARRYLAADQIGATVAVFAHGGYFILGDVDLQDGYCRHLARAIRGAVYSVDYALAPECHAESSVQDLIDCVATARGEHPHARVILCGDSAGGAIAFDAASRLRDHGHPVDALFLTNPNLDLSMSMFDRAAPRGPDPDLLSGAIAAWAGPNPIAAGFSPLHSDPHALPPTLIAVGALDGLQPEAIAMAEHLRAVGVRATLLFLSGVGHGFVAGGDRQDATARDEALAALTNLLDTTR